MRVSVYLALCGALTLCALLRRVTRSVSPPWAASTLAAGALLAAVAWVWDLGLLAGTLIGQFDIVADVGHWSGPALDRHTPVPDAVAGVAGALVAVASITLMACMGRLGRERRQLRAAIRDCPEATADGLLVIEDPRPRALAMPQQGRIVITTGMVRALSAEERRVVLAHERAHLRGRHGHYRAAVRLAAAILPVLRPVVGDCDYQLERWADEVAAREVGDRHIAAGALARAALASRAAGAGASGSRSLAFSQRGVTSRIRALLADPPRRHLVRLAGPMLLFAAAAALSIEASQDLEDLLETAQRVWGS
ncbi:MAG: M56 family metallopeptidase [Frankiaceae bacterium]|jgi:hypothetical protein